MKAWIQTTTCQLRGPRSTRRPLRDILFHQMLILEDRKNNMELERCLKLVSGFYSLMAMAGGGTAGFGIWSKVNRTSQMFGMLTSANNSLASIFHVTTTSNLLIVGGFFVFLLSLIGCFGALKRKSWMMLVFFVIVLIIFIVQISLAVIIVMPSSLKEKALSNLDGTIIQNIENRYKPDSQFIHLWDGAMTKLKCCGYKGFADFTNSTFVKEKSFYPAPCCGNDLTSICTKEKAEKQKVRGCYQMLLEEMLPVSGPLAFLIGILEIIAMIVSLTVYRCLRRLPG